MLRIITIDVQKAINPNYYQQTVHADEIKDFKNYLTEFLKEIHQINEEYCKKSIHNFLEDSFYKKTNKINVHDRIDAAIFSGKNGGKPIVLFEIKTPNNKSEFLDENNSNRKALWEIILYYLKERLNNNNLEIRNLIITNCYQWFCFDENEFYKQIASNTEIKKAFNQFKTHNNSDHFYNDIRLIFDHSDITLEATYFDIRKFKPKVEGEMFADSVDDEEVRKLYKFFSPEHLIKKPIENDTNSLNKDFYRELLYILGLEEVKSGGKKILDRMAKPNPASFIENIISKLKDTDEYSNIADKDNEIFEIAMELLITWLNRILFLKLLEAQLRGYHSNAEQFKFLNYHKINSYNELKELFFQVLAKKIGERSPHLKEKYLDIPYLNSSLFEETEYEKKYVGINDLSDIHLPIGTNSILKKNENFKTKDALHTLEYILEFLDSFDYSNDKKQLISNNKKDLIKASVLGLIYEKLNGYKEGSYFTPSYITMYMARESCRQAVIQKFNDAKIFNKEIKNFEELKSELEFQKPDVRKQANEIINSLKICDPAVGSGHFLVSVLNEIISIKNDLKVLSFYNIKNNYELRVSKEWNIEIENDELVITDTEDNSLFEYKINENGFIPKHIQALQETLFYEKQTIIENCLFGVDINPKSVLICRLRLWIELLKNAYYTNTSDYRQTDNDGLTLQTLPNIDINIKFGNSLVNKYKIDHVFDLKKDKNLIPDYRAKVNEYKNTNNRSRKSKLKLEIDNYKFLLSGDIIKESNKVFELSKLKRTHREKFEINEYTSENKQKEYEKSKLASEKKIEKLENEIKKESELKNTIYKNSMEWRFEFPEVLDDSGNFIGFDLIIGNPPYIKEYDKKSAFDGLRDSKYYLGKMDLWYFFVSFGLELLVKNGFLSFIAQNNWVTSFGASKLRKHIMNEAEIINMSDFNDYFVFENADIQTMTFLLKKDAEIDNYPLYYRKLVGTNLKEDDILEFVNNKLPQKSLELNPIIKREEYFDKTLHFESNKSESILLKIKSKQNCILEKSEMINGIHSHHDKVTKKHIEKLPPSSKINDGIFSLSSMELKNLQLNNIEKKLIKPYFAGSELQRYYNAKSNSSWLIYTDSTFKNIKKIEKYPNIKEHILKYINVITSDNKPFGLHRARKEKFFKNEKIFALRKTTIPYFTFSDVDCYVSAAFYSIQTKKINLKYLTALLNSKLIAFWLRNRGKMQGNNYQIDKEPLLNIPIFNPENPEPIITLVDQIISSKKAGKDTTALEAQIDHLVYKLYNLTDEEIRIVEGGD